MKSIFLIYFMLISFLGHCVSQEASCEKMGLVLGCLLVILEVQMYVIFHLILWKVSAGVFFSFLRVWFFFSLSSRYLIIMTLKLSSSVDGHSFCLEKHCGLRFPLRLSLRQFAFSLSCRVGVEVVWVWSHQDEPGGEPQEAHGRRAAVCGAVLCPCQEGQRFWGWLRPWPW